MTSFATFEKALAAGGMIELPLEMVRADEHNPRGKVQSAKVAALATSLRETGQLQPIGVMPRFEDQVFVVAFGHRRLAAAKRAKLSTIKAIEYVPHAGGESQHVPGSVTWRIAQLAENHHREALDPIAQAQAIAALRDQHDISIPEIAAAMKASGFAVNRTALANQVALLELPFEAP